MPSRTPRLVAAVALAGLGLVGACGGDDDGGDSAEFCRLLSDNHQQLFVDVPASEQAADDLVALMGELGEVAPLAIAEEWQQLTDVFEQVANSDEPGGQADLAAVYASQPAAMAVQTWARDNCGVEIAVGQVPEPGGASRVTTLPPVVTTAAPTG